VFLFSDGSFGRHHFVTGDNSHTIAWMPMSELPKFGPIPDPPEGWRFVEKDEAFDGRAQYWSTQSNKFLLAWQDDAYDSSLIYIVPIDPPKPTYRPFANAAEFMPYANKFVVCKGSDEYYKVNVVNNNLIWFTSKSQNALNYRELLADFEFDDGTPCGVKVSE
jgi:hypothetical protein